MTHHLVLGAGPTGVATARLLADSGDIVTLASRSGKGPIHPRISLASVDASVLTSLVPLARGAATIFQCAMPRYDRWTEEFPPIQAAAIHAAVTSGAALVTLGNVYVYGPCVGAFDEHTPLAPNSDKGRVRTAMWRAALESGARVTEVRASDFLGAGAMSLFTILVLPALVAGAAPSYPGDLDAPHPWSFIDDVARTLVAAARNDASWGRAWHVPSRSASVREVHQRFVTIGNYAAVPITQMPRSVLEQGDSLSQAVVEMLYLMDSAVVLDASETERVLGVNAAPLDVAVRSTLAP